jgi:hypothetical protein
VNGHHASFSPQHNPRRQGDITKFNLVEGCDDCLDIKERYGLAELQRREAATVAAINEASETYEQLKPLNARLEEIAQRPMELAASLGLPSYIPPSQSRGIIAAVEAKTAKNLKFHGQVILERGRAVLYTSRGKPFGVIFDDNECRGRRSLSRLPVMRA